jgi:hypothetical protein
LTLNAGLCGTCRHQRIVRTTRGSAFSLCERSRTDPRFPRYPRLPVVQCDGYEQDEQREASRE